MNSKIRKLAIIMVTLAATAGPAGPAAGADRGMEEQIQSARSGADHEAIAAQYDAEAKGLLAQAEQHDRMGKLYRGMELGGGKGPKFAGHCEAMAANLRTAAGQNEELAQLHRDLAAEAPQ